MFEFHKHLKSVRKNNNKTQKQVAEAISATERGYQRYESGEQLPGFEFLISLANYFDVSLDYLVGRTDNPNSHKGGENI